MRVAIAAIVVLLVACKHEPKDKPAPPPPPVHADASPVPTPATSCAIKLNLAGGGVSWTAGDAAGATADGIDERAIADAVTAAVAADGPCTATISATDTTPYHDVSSVLEAIVTGGVRDVVLDIDGGTRASPLPPGADKPGPTVTITAEAIKVSGTDVAKLDDPQLPALLGHVLDSKQTAQPGTKAVIQADKATLWRDLVPVVRTAKLAGFTDLLFAVKNQ